MDKQRLEKGEIVFLWLMLIASLVLAWFSWQLFRKNMLLSAEGAFPMLVSLIMFLMAILSFGEIRGRERGFDKGVSLLTMAREQVQWLLPGRTALIVLYVLIYAIILKRVGFIISTYAFLVGSSVTLYPHKIVKTAIVSAVLIAAIVLIFQVLFKVRLP